MSNPSIPSVAMAWFESKGVDCAGSVLFRGSLPPRAEEFEFLTQEGFELDRTPDAPDLHWRLSATHPKWGAAEIVCLREKLMPPDYLIDFDPRLLPNEKEHAKLAGSSVSVRMTLPGKNVLRERKHLLRYLRALMADDGLVVVDHTAQAFWSRDDLDEELSHDAELDIQSLFSLHLVGDDERAPHWLHSHGFKELGWFDFDILDPSEALAHSEGGAELVRAVAFAIVEDRAVLDGPALELVGGHQFCFVPASAYRKAAGSRHPKWLAELDDEHTEDHAIICDAVSNGWFGLFRGKPSASRLLSEEIGDNVLLNFSDEASDLMARRARGSLEVLQHLSDEFGELELPCLVKLRYEGVDGGGGEHLWFEVHEFGDGTVDATLTNDPFQDIGMVKGDRREHEVDRLSDWMLLTPAGGVTPRTMRTARLVRAHFDELRAALKESRS